MVGRASDSCDGCAVATEDCRFLLRTGAYVCSGRHALVSNVERIAETARLLEDKVAIIAGSGRGIGLTAALLLIGAALDHFGRLDIIVNNAGYTHDGLIHEISDEQWHAMPECHPTAPFRILRAASACWREIAKQEAQNGRPQVREVVNVSPASGGADNAGQINYAGVA